MGQINPTVPVTGNLNSIADPELANAVTAIIQLVNGNLDATNMSAAFLQSIGGNTAAKGVTANSGTGTRTNVAYGPLSDAPDQVAGIVLPTNGLLRVWFQAQWSDPSNLGRAAIFVGTNQLQVQNGMPASPGPVTEAAVNTDLHLGLSTPLVSCPFGLVCAATASTNAFGADVTTGQAVAGISNSTLQVELGGSITTLLTASGGVGGIPLGGPCDIIAAAGTYTISVQYKSSSGTVTASNRRLYVQAISFT